MSEKISIKDRVPVSNAVVTCETKLFQNYFRSLLQLMNIVQHVHCRWNNSEIFSAAEIILFQFQTWLAYMWIWCILALQSDICLQQILRFSWESNDQISCRIWKHVNSTKHWIAIASKTVTGHYESSTVLQQVNDQSDQQCKFLGISVISVVVFQFQFQF